MESLSFNEFNLYKEIFENCFSLINKKESKKTFIKILLIKAENNKKENKIFFESHAIYKRWSYSYGYHEFSFCNTEKDWYLSFQYDKEQKYNTNKVYELLFKELKENNIKNIEGIEKYFNGEIDKFIYNDNENYVFSKIIDGSYKLNGNGVSILDFSNDKYFAYNRNNYDGIKYILSRDNFKAWYEEYANFKK